MASEAYPDALARAEVGEWWLQMVFQAALPTLAGAWIASLKSLAMAMAHDSHHRGHHQWSATRETNRCLPLYAFQETPALALGLVNARDRRQWPATRESDLRGHPAHVATAAALVLVYADAT